jgi:hypothetical protein
MGQAVADLPDPLEQAEAGDVVSVDDLLAQMAGAEIDRLLAEAESGRGGSSEQEGADAATLAAVRDDDLPVEQQLDQLFTELQDQGLATVHAEDEGPEDDGRAEDDMPLADDPADEDADQTTESEWHGLSGITLHVPNGPGVAADPVYVTASTARGGLVIRLLEILNAPLAGCSPAVHALVGKAAIITLLNAIAVLIYVLLFR